MKRITAVVGDYYHQEDNGRQALQAALQKWAGPADVSLRYVEAGRLEEALAEAPDAVVLFKEDRVAPQEDDQARWMTEAVAASIARYVQDGGGWLAWHSGLASYDPDGAYVTMLHGHFLHHPHTHQIVRYTPEGSGFPGLDQAFEFVDEHYFVACDTERTEVFLRSSSVDGNSIAGWRHEEGRGRVCCLTPAHRQEGLGNPDFLHVLGQTLRWCCKAE